MAGSTLGGFIVMANRGLGACPEANFAPVRCSATDGAPDEGNGDRNDEAAAKREKGGPAAQSSPRNFQGNLLRRSDQQRAVHCLENHAAKRKGEPLEPKWPPKRHSSTQHPSTTNAPLAPHCYFHNAAIALSRTAPRAPIKPIPCGHLDRDVNITSPSNEVNPG